VPTPQPGGTLTNDINELFEVVCVSAANCWAVGSYGVLTFPGTFLNQALHWNSSAWTQVTTPEPDGTGTGAIQQLVFANCKSATNCWAVGLAKVSGGSFFGTALHWNGTVWSPRMTRQRPDATRQGPGVRSRAGRH
jgi:hypothetical protein